MNKRIIILGAGHIGRTIARDLAADASLDATVVDFSERNLARLRGVDCLAVRRADLADDAALRDAIRDADVVVGALPSAMGFRALRTVIDAGKSYADISFMPDDALALDDHAKKRGVTAVVDCGVAPGLANLFIGRCAAAMSRLTDVCYYVGGLPRRRSWPYQYKAPFAPLDVIEEYTRPARLIENGRQIVRPALSDLELIEFDEIGTLEAFNTDGLRSLLTTIRAENMREKTLRYPGHAELMRVLRETGYFGGDEIALRDGRRVRPIDVTGALLFPMWEHKPGEEEFTILRVIVEGFQNDAHMRFTYDLFDRTDTASGASSMARTTGFPCAIVARMLADGRLKRPGVFAPEVVGEDAALTESLLTELNARGVCVMQRVEAIA